MAADEEDEETPDRRPTRKKTAGKSRDADAGDRTSDRGTERAARRVSAPRAMRYAAEQLQELLGRAPESVSAVQPTEDGWMADVEVLELERVPTTSSVMASYRVTLDEEGELMSYERTRRYTKGQVGQG
ncbi:gas vesicle protein [Streptomyces nigrescens]|uniref:Gas vesicle protein n=2 Tax=Streptomyces TaxID=1883 RepID=A0ABM7ZQX2_STRNI|nr:gas vesicle protein [Streptomyces nigrescens]MEE4419779.1 gas vesicle protein [Streptomyces sp. DSM 41528]BDM68792.1 gas vesicle protein [Streptomyces nigrescens]